MKTKTMALEMKMDRALFGEPDVKEYFVGLGGSACRVGVTFKRNMQMNELQAWAKHLGAATFGRATSMNAGGLDYSGAWFQF